MSTLTHPPESTSGDQLAPTNREPSDLKQGCAGAVSGDDSDRTVSTSSDTIKDILIKPKKEGHGQPHERQATWKAGKKRKKQKKKREEEEEGKQRTETSFCGCNPSTHKPRRQCENTEDAKPAMELGRSKS